MDSSAPGDVMSEPGRCALPYRAITAVLTCVLVAFGIAFGAGALEIRRPVKPAPPSPEPEAPSAYVQRDKAAEMLFENQPKAATRDGLRDRYNTWVYKFGGGIPKCWAEIESEGNKQTIGPWEATKEVGFLGADPSDHPLLESVEGYLALFGPTSEMQRYQMSCGITKVEYPQNAKNDLRMSACRKSLEVTLPKLLPAAPEGIKSSGFSDRGEGSERRIVPVGQDTEVARLNYQTESGGSCTIQLKIRFLTAEEIAAKR
jgi:hypothetical protein